MSTAPALASADAPAPAVPSARPATAFRHDLAGLRGVAVLLVAIYHVWVGRVSGGVDVFLLLSAFFLTGGWVRSVEAGRPRSVLGSWLKRARGLLPAAMLTLTVTVCVTLLIQPATRWAETLKQAWASLAYTQNQHLQQLAVDYYAADHSAASPLQHFWSLSVQGQVFLLWPLLLAGGALVARALSALNARRGAAPVSFRAVMIAVFLLLGAVSFVYSVQYTASHQSQAYFSTAARLWEFALGSLLALVVDRMHALPRWLSRALGWAGIAALLSCGLLLEVEGQFPGYAALWPTVAAAAIVLAGTGTYPTSRKDVGWWLSRRPATWLGSISYPLYLWHWPVLVLTLFVLGRENANLWQGGLILGGSVVLAWLTHRFVEAPVARWTAGRRRPDRAPRLEARAPRRATTGPSRTARRMGSVLTGAWSRNARTVAVVVVSLVAVVPVAMWQNVMTTQQRAAAAQPDRDNPGAASLEAGFVDETEPGSIALPLASEIKDDWALAGEDCTAEWAMDVVEGGLCRQGGSAEASKTIAFVGDSHSQQWSPALAAAAELNGDWNWVLIVRPGCRYGDPSNEAEDERCAEHNAAAERYVLGHAKQLDAVLVVGSRTVEPEAVGEAAPEETVVPGLRTALEPWTKAGLPVVALRDTPRLPFDVADCEATLTRKTSQCEGQLDQLIAPENPLASLAHGPHALKGVSTIDFNDVVCPDGTCAPVIGNVNVWLDDSHLTAKFASTAGAVFERRLRGALGW